MKVHEAFPGESRGPSGGGLVWNSFVPIARTRDDGEANLFHPDDRGGPVQPRGSMEVVDGRDRLAEVRTQFLKDPA